MHSVIVSSGSKARSASAWTPLSYKRASPFYFMKSGGCLWHSNMIIVSMAHLLRHKPLGVMDPFYLGI